MERGWEILFVTDGRGLFFRVEGFPFLADFLLDGFFLFLTLPFAPFLVLLELFLLLPALWDGAGGLPPPEPESDKSQVCLFIVCLHFVRNKRDCFYFLIVNYLPLSEPDDFPEPLWGQAGEQDSGLESSAAF